jgi:hypothetical protein
VYALCFLSQRGSFPATTNQDAEGFAAWTGLVTINTKAPRLRDLPLLDRLDQSRA